MINKNFPKYKLIYIFHIILTIQSLVDLDTMTANMVSSSIASSSIISGQKNIGLRGSCQDSSVNTNEKTSNILPKIDPITYTKQQIKLLFNSVGEGPIHGYVHALRVYHHAKKALNEIKYLWRLHIDQYIAVLLAALLHDVDDDKIFGGGHDDLPNARRILNDIAFGLTNEVLEMISLVGFSTNGIRDVYRSNDQLMQHNNCNKNSRGTLHQIPKWKLIPRDADRLEALGCIGIARCIGYGIEIGRPLHNKFTPRLANEWEIKKLAIRYWLDPEYDRSYSTLDYFIQGLIIRSIMSTNINYFVTAANQRRAPIIKLLLIYSSYGYLNKKLISLITSGDTQANTIIHDLMTN